MLNPSDFPPPEVIDLEQEADARGYFASDEEDPGGEGGAGGGPRPVVPLTVSRMRR
jgi:hypothetical protein